MTSPPRRRPSARGRGGGGLGVVAASRRRLEEQARAEAERRASEEAILARQSQLRAAARERRSAARRRKEDALRRCGEADVVVERASRAAELAISTSKRAVAELNRAREAAARARGEAAKAEKELGEFARLEREIEEMFHGNGAGEAEAGEDGEDRREGGRDEGDGRQREDDGLVAAEAIASMESEMRSLSEEEHWKRQYEEMARRCEDLAEEAARAREEAEAQRRDAEAAWHVEAGRLSAATAEWRERATRAEAAGKNRAKVMGEMEMLLEWKDGELARVKAEAEEAAEQAARDAAEAAAALEEERARRTKEEEEEAARAREDAATAAVAATKSHLVVLVSRGVADVQQAADQSHALRLLDDLRVPYKEVDGMDDGISPEAMRFRDALFKLSGMRGNYPQLFKMDGNNEMGYGTYLGDLAWLEGTDPDELRGMFGRTVGGAFDKDAEIARLSKLLKEARDETSEEVQRLTTETEELGDALIKASELLEGGGERARALEEEVARLKSREAAGIGSPEPPEAAGGFEC